MNTETTSSGSENVTVTIEKPRVRAKVKVHEITILQGWDSKKNGYCEARRFKMQIVSDGSEENKFYSHISGGTNIELQTINSSVFESFEVNGEYYVDFIPANK